MAATENALTWPIFELGICSYQVKSFVYLKGQIFYQQQQSLPANEN